MLHVVASAWPLFLGLGMLLLGNGLQNSLLGIRAGAEAFPTAVTGLVMSCYYLGFIVGSIIAPKVVANVGHVRVFSALASLASVAALVHGVFVEPFTWGAMRFVTGFAYAGLFVVAESWLNDRATNQTRGQLLSVYMLVMLGGMVGGQGLLNLADTDGVLLFVLASVLVSLALVPISLTAGPAPSFEAPAKVGLLELYRTSPLGVIGALATGLAHGVLFGMGAVYGEKIGLSVAEISLFMGMAIGGGLIFQWPIGRLSDRFDRRRVLTIVSFLAAIFATAALPFAARSVEVLFVLTLLFGGMTLPIYSLCIAHTHDHLAPAQVVAASGTLVLVGGIGASFGPTLAAGLMALIGPDGFYLTLAAVHAGIGFFALYRMSRREAMPLEEQGPAIPAVSGAGASRLTAEALRDQMDADLAQLTGMQRRRY